MVHTITNHFLSFVISIIADDSKVIFAEFIFFFYKTLIPGQYNLTGSLPAAILGKAYSWTCSIFTPVDQKYTVVKFTRNSILVGTVGWNSDGTCLPNTQSSRYELHCVSENVFSLSIPPASMTKYEESSDWRCGYFGDESYKSKVVQLKIAGNSMKVFLETGNSYKH